MGMYFGRSAPGLYTRIFVISHLHQHLTADMECNVKHFANDTSLLTVLHCPNSASEKIDHDLALESPWTHDWRMSFTLDPQKQAVELLFSKKRLAVGYPFILFNNIPVKQVDEHKHLGLI